MMELGIDLTLLLVLLGLWYRGIAFIVWSTFLIAAMALWWMPPLIVWLLLLPVYTVMILPKLRKELISDRIVAFLSGRNLLPKISETEKTALRAGTVWIDGELFSGKPNFRRIFTEPYPALNDEEEAYLNNQVETLCAMTDDNTVFKERDLSDATWEYMKKERFFGMIIPKEYGGLGFSALGHSAVVQKLASRSQVLAITAMVPNSIGPAELLMEHGTQEQKDHYLPRLADGRDIPCFALTEPLAGSDATSIASYGELFKDESGAIKIRLNFEKRYITLGAIATVIGLAFVLRDPEGILSGVTELGITFALVPSSSEGVVQGRRHDPLGVPFINSPISGKDVVIGIDDIIGAEAGIGQGWKMLMESLSVGRGISLPSTGSGGMKHVARVSGAYSRIREQFGIPVAHFEGIQYELARIAAYTYMMDAARIFTIGAIDKGEKPAVLNAVMKYHATEKFRDVINSGMDVVGGAGIILGPRNLLGHSYMEAPIAITVEGANIMTRTLIQFGQGVIRCHPHAYLEIEALEQNDTATFDRHFWLHVGFAMRNGIRALLLSLTRGYLHIPASDGIAARYERKLAWSSALFAFLTDFMLGYYGGSLKQKEMISARFGDILSHMYLLIATLRRYEDGGRSDEERELVIWVGEYCLYEIQQAFESVFANLGAGILRMVFAGPVRWFARINAIGQMPTDRRYKVIAEEMSRDSKMRDLLCEGTFVPEAQEESLGKIESAIKEIAATEELAERIKTAVKHKTVPKMVKPGLYKAALDAGVIEYTEYQRLMRLYDNAVDIVTVDDYTVEAYKNRE
jgi:acyl-CoA dehydrogenase